MPNDLFLSLKVRRSQYLGFERASDREAIADFFSKRFTERFVAPIEKEPKHGFTTMAVSCLLIETLESFWSGWPSTHGRSELAFCRFFSRSPRFHLLLGHVPEFYGHVRCGILHQAETTGGWTIMRTGELFDPAGLTINATKFHRALQLEIQDYASLLRAQPWDCERWVLFRKKMKAICDNCDR